MKLAAALLATILLLVQAVPIREVAITIDDLPGVGRAARDAATLEAATLRLLAALAAHKVPAIGFVNENKLDGNPGREAQLRRWLDAGQELGNHAFSHPDLHTTALDAFKEDVLKGERVTRPLMAARGLSLRFFRHPFLHTGRSLDTRGQLEAFLAKHGYRVAPVTIDNDEYIFARAYDRSIDAGDEQLTRRIAASYISYMEAKFEFFERNSRDLFNREIPQILLIHANLLNADHFGALASMIEKRGYRFTTLEHALEDPAFKSPDTFVGPGGITWLHRWALTRGMPKEFYGGEPGVPPFVSETAR